MLIEGQEYTLLKDYDTGKYHYLSFEGKLTYLRSRVDLILIEPLRKIVPSLLENTLGLVLTTAICAGISAAGTYLKGRRALRGKDKKYFVDFVKKYMDSRLQQEAIDQKSWADWLYDDVRCGLAHNFTIMNGGIEVQVRQYVELKQSGPEINPEMFLEDFAKGWSNYLEGVAKAGPSKELGHLFEQRFDQVFHD